MGSSSKTGGVDPRAFIYLAATGQMVDLNSYLPSGSGWVLKTAEDISDNGRYIVGAGVYNGAQHAYILDLAPVPEPAAVWMLAAGLGVVVMRLRHLRRDSRRAVASRD